MDDLSRYCCLNSDCPEHGKRGAGNLTVTSRCGAHRGRRMLRGSACKARFSERKGTPLFDSRLPPEKADQGPWRSRSPAMAAGPADHVWSLPVWLAFPSVQH